MRLPAAPLAALALAMARLGLGSGLNTAPPTAQEAAGPGSGRHLRGESQSHRRGQELQAYVADTGRMDPKVANSRELQDRKMWTVDPSR